LAINEVQWKNTQSKAGAAARKAAAFLVLQMEK
jgi:hypothetical protein